MLTPRSFFWFLALLVSIAVDPPCADTASASLTKIRVGYPSPSASMYPLFVTKEAGIFEKYGFDAELIYVQGVQMVHVHTAGQLDFTSTSGIVTLQSSVNGSDLILLANSIESHLMKVIVHPSISGPADLKGKSIGVTRFGSLTDLALRPILEQWKLEPNKDVKILANMGLTIEGVSSSRDSGTRRNRSPCRSWWEWPRSSTGSPARGTRRCACGCP